MDNLIGLMITIGILIMVTNIIRYVRFIFGSSDVLSSGRRIDRVWEYISLGLLAFFLVGYIFVVKIGEPDLMVAGILFGGSIFVAIVLTLMFTLIRTVKENSLSIAETLIGVVDARDPNLKGHSRYVRNVSMVIYDHLPQHRKGRINRISLEFAALMHDVGKLGIPEEILNKPAPLNDDEWVIMKNHPRLGTDIMKPLGSLREILPWIEFHHERMDGGGYYNLKGHEIPFPARVIAVADTYCAITMRRSYKPPRSYEEAAKIIKSVSGTQLDREIAEIFLTIPKEKLMACIPENVEALDVALKE